MRKITIQTALLAVACLGALACASAIQPTRFVNPEFNFGFVEKAAVLPLENLTNDQQAGVRATRLLITELLATGTVDVVEPGEVRAAFESVGDRRRIPTTEQIVEMGKRLGVQAIVIGTVTQSESLRSGTVAIPVVTLDVHMLETETGRKGIEAVYFTSFVMQ